MREEQGVTGARILIVEDDALLGLDLKGHLERAGFSVMRSAAAASKALAFLTRDGCDAAILDVHLGEGHSSEPVAQELRLRGTPFVTVTAYFHEHRPQVYSGFPVLSKPEQALNVLAELQRCLEMS
jgi:DNA-binding response OmpR family regulator